jgi:hypothetical protein
MEMHLAQLSIEVVQYITEQRQKYRGSAIPLSLRQMTAMAGYFPDKLLTAVRLRSLRNERVETPSFSLRELDLIGQTTFTMMAAITFSDVIVANVPLTDGIFFHELVHCEQYRQLGIRSFAESYARGYLDECTGTCITLWT